MEYLQGIIILILGLGISVALHELGHLIPARIFGVLCTQYMIGFGPTLWSRQLGETQVGIKAILLGGYVRMVGMYAPGSPGRKTTNRKGEMTWAEEARQLSQREIPPGQESRAFYALPTWKRLVIMLSGTLMNLVLSLLCVLLALSVIGVNQPSLTIASVSPGSPAQVAGLQPGDTVEEWNNQSVDNWEQMRHQISQTQGEAQIRVKRGGEEHTVAITPESVEGHSVIGVLPAYSRQRLPWGQSLETSWNMGVGTAGILAVLPVKLWQTLTGLFEPDKPRDKDSVMGVVGMGQIAGQIASTQAQGYGFADKAVSFLMLFASLNMTLFLFNLIPLMPLDGGQAAGAIYESWRNAVRRLRGLPASDPVDLARLLPLTTVLVGSFIAMTVLLIVADILKPL